MAASYLLDSNTIIAGIRGEPPSLLNRLASLALSRLYMSALVRAELLYGAEKSHSTAKARATLAVFVDGFEPLPFDDAAAQAYGRIRAALERKGATIGSIDLLIAAQAVSRDLVLVTDNLREFRRVPGLACENWLR